MASDARAAATDPMDALKLRMREAGFLTNADYRTAFGVNRDSARTGLQDWIQDGRLVMAGTGKGTRYLPGPKWGQ